MQHRSRPGRPRTRARLVLACCALLTVACGTTPAEPAETPAAARIDSLEREVCDHLSAAFESSGRPREVAAEWAAARDTLRTLEREQGGASDRSRLLDTFLDTADPSRLGYTGDSEAAVSATVEDTADLCGFE